MDGIIKGSGSLFLWLMGHFSLMLRLFSFVFPDFAGLDAFNRLDTILHSIVGASGLIIGTLE